MDLVRRSKILRAQLVANGFNPAMVAGLPSVSLTLLRSNFHFSSRPSRLIDISGFSMISNFVETINTTYLTFAFSWCGDSRGIRADKV